MKRADLGTEKGVSSQRLRNGLRILLLLLLLLFLLLVFGVGLTAYEDGQRKRQAQRETGGSGEQSGNTASRKSVNEREAAVGQPIVSHDGLANTHESGQPNTDGQVGTATDGTALRARDRDCCITTAVPAVGDDELNRSDRMPDTVSHGVTACGAGTGTADKTVKQPTGDDDSQDKATITKESRQPKEMLSFQQLEELVQRKREAMLRVAAGSGCGEQAAGHVEVPLNGMVEQCGSSASPAVHPLPPSEASSRPPYSMAPDSLPIHNAPAATANPPADSTERAADPLVIVTGNPDDQIIIDIV